MQLLMIAGNVGKDATLRRTNNGDPVLSFPVAVDNGKDKEGNKRPATWYDCSIWGKRAESLEPHITKGQSLTLWGRPTARAHEGKAYLGLSVSGVAFQGGGQSRQDTGYQSGDPPGSVSSGSMGGGPDMDDEIPFAAEWRI